MDLGIAARLARHLAQCRCAGPRSTISARAILSLALSQVAAAGLPEDRQEARAGYHRHAARPRVVRGVIDMARAARAGRHRRGVGDLRSSPICSPRSGARSTRAFLHSEAISIEALVALDGGCAMRMIAAWAAARRSSHPAAATPGEEAQRGDHGGDDGERRRMDVPADLDQVSRRLLSAEEATLSRRGRA